MSIQNKMRFFILFILLFCGISCKVLTNDKAVFQLSKIETDSLFNSQQKIYLLSVNLKHPKYKIDIAYDELNLVKTSEFAKNNKAIAAINGGFFNMAKGGSVSYLEKNHKTINEILSEKWKKTGIINGAIILNTNNKIQIESLKSVEYYENSKNENFVLTSGPILLKNSIPQALPEISFTKKRHPRTCLCKTNNSIVFVVIDGRNTNADGMSLYETQKYLLDLGCVDAINLDGGGSSTMWIKDRGIFNIPSDKKGERPVANALLLLAK